MKDAGLRLLLEAHRDLNKNPQIIDKITMLRPSLPPSSSSPYSPTTLPATGFLDACFLCRKPLSPNSDIYMYRGDRAFCSVECRCRQIFLDEVEETSKKENCSVTAAASRRGKANRNRAGRLFAY